MPDAEYKILLTASWKRGQGRMFELRKRESILNWSK